MTNALVRTATTVEQMIRSKSAEFNEALAHQVDPDRLVRVALSEIRGNPKLQKCSPASLVSAILASGKLGLEPGLLGQAYLVPYGQECTLIVGYRGLIDLARRSGEVEKIEARLVYEHDDFAVSFGTDEEFTHRPKMFGDRGAVIGVYAEAYYQSGTVQREFMTREEVEAIRSRSRAGKSGPWVTDWPEMARKTVVRRLVKYLPLTVETMRGLTDADAIEFGDFRDKPSRGEAVDLSAALTGAPQLADEPIDVEPGPTTDGDGQYTDDGQEPPDDWPGAGS
tara:strand:+ start:34 stop:876 length:843 start_codon:yes stop_codon:yes gene_type:complete